MPKRRPSPWATYGYDRASYPSQRKQYKAPHRPRESAPGAVRLYVNLDPETVKQVGDLARRRKEKSTQEMLRILIETGLEELARE